MFYNDKDEVLLDINSIVDDSDIYDSGISEEKQQIDGLTNEVKHGKVVSRIDSRIIDYKPSSSAMTNQMKNPIRMFAFVFSASLILV